jgi:hypothetical protein
VRLHGLSCTLLPMKGRMALLVAVAISGFASVGAVACGGGGGSGGDGGPDGTIDTGGDLVHMFDVRLPDGQQGDNTGFDVPPKDGGGDGPSDSTVKGGCSPVNTGCDIVSQNCPAKHECVVVGDPDAASGVGTACVSTQPSEHLGKGAACCPNGVNNPCDPGLSCVGNPCVDGGQPSGRCSPACCPASEAGAGSGNCGLSSPEGFPGSCSLTEVYNGHNLYDVCIYEEPCTALGVKPCPTGSGCNVQDMSGTSFCVGIFGPDGGSVGAPVGSTCQDSNYCADGLMCITFGDAGSGTCTYLCYTSAATPFDAGLLNGTPGHGGCPGGSSCENNISFLPAWLGLCVPP